jgi:hypothetical protein
MRPISAPGVTDEQLVGMAQGVCNHMDMIEAKAYPAGLREDREGNDCPNTAYSIGYAGMMDAELTYRVPGSRSQFFTEAAAHYFCPQHSWEIARTIDMPDNPWASDPPAPALRDVPPPTRYVSPPDDCGLLDYTPHCNGGA